MPIDSSYIWLIFAAVLNAVANLLLKSTANGHESDVANFLSLSFLASIFCFGMGVIVYTKALTKLHVSLAYPLLVGLCYVLIVMGSFFFFNEKLSIVNYLGFAITVLGMYLLQL